MKIEIEVTEKDIADTLCSAFEGGIGYWARIAGHRHPMEAARPWGDEYTPDYISFPLSEGGEVRLAVTEGNGEGMTIKPLSRETIAAGLKLMAEKYPRHFADMLGENGDATTGDVLVQLAVFGEIVFG